MLINSSTTHPVEKDRMQYQFLVKKKKRNSQLPLQIKYFSKANRNHNTLGWNKRAQILKLVLKEEMSTSSLKKKKNSLPKNK